jgi:hypothetical protein
VLIAATFCMLNRYVDGLAAVTPDDPPTSSTPAECSGSTLTGC